MLQLSLKSNHKPQWREEKGGGGIKRSGGRGKKQKWLSSISTRMGRKEKQKKEEGCEGRLLRHLGPNSESLSADKSLCFMNGS